MREGGIRLAREGEGIQRSDEDGDTVEGRTHRAARHTATGLPPRTFGKINRIQEKSPMVRQASRSPLLSFSHIFLPLSLSQSLFCRLPLVHPPRLSRALVRARAVSVFARATKRGRARVCTLATEMGGMRARTTAKDGDKYTRARGEQDGRCGSVRARDSERIRQGASETSE